MSVQPYLLTREQAAEFLSVGKRTIDRLVAAGELETRYFSRTGMRITTQSCIDWADKLPTDRDKSGAGAGTQHSHG